MTVRLSSGISANILDFGIPQKHVLADVAAMETPSLLGQRGRSGLAGEVQAY
jgi:hypothetical protein